MSDLLRAVVHRISSRRAHQRMHRAVAHNWTLIAARHGHSYASFWKQFGQRSELAQLCNPFIGRLTSERIIELATKAVEQRFNLLGSGERKFDTIPWHHDFRLAQQEKDADCSFDASRFFGAVRITTGPDWQLTKDVKLPWELSRFYHAPVLAQAYVLTKDERYLRALSEQVKDWIGANPYRYGVNWYCSMEVAIRALNWIYAIGICAPHTNDLPYELLSCSLYDHMQYLEHNWEFYDGRTNNHYLSNLVGYLACCWYFAAFEQTAKKAAWAWKEILREFKKTTFEEGTSYEGATAYHGLVTELYEHGFHFASLLGFQIPDFARERLVRMKQFATLTQGLHIGDNDSGRVTTFGLAQLPEKTSGTVGYPKFGLSVHTDSIWNISIRQHAYTRKQPSGHFHSDVGSVTVAVRDVPLFVDPGAYVYTPSAQWRNYFRQMRNHNTFMLADIEPIPITDNLWKLAVPARTQSGIDLRSSHTLYKKFGVIAHRTLAVDDHTLTFTDSWQGMRPLPFLPPTTWNFTLAPTITAHLTQDGVAFSHRGKKIAELVSDGIDWTLEPAWYAPSYGVKEATIQLRGQRATQVGRKTVLKLVAS